MVRHGCVDDSGVSKRTILPSSHTGGCRYFMKNFQDGLAICRVHGALDLISTFACNAKGPEITKAPLLEPGPQPCDIRAGCISGHVKAGTISYLHCISPYVHTLGPLICYLHLHVQYCFVQCILSSSKSEVCHMLTSFFWRDVDMNHQVVQH